MAFIHFIWLLFSFLVCSLQAYDSADVRFEVEKGFGKRLTLKAFERSSLLFSQTVDPTFNAALIFGKNVLSRQGNGYKILYKGRDETSLSLEVDQNGNISLAGASEQTGFEKRKSWGFKTFGIIRHQGSSLFYNLLTQAQQFHNLGILKSYTGELLQNYLFNRGIIHFGDETAFVSPTAYQGYLTLLARVEQPVYENGIIDDRGVILAEKGLRISDLTHRSRGFVDIGGQGLDLYNAGIDNHGEMNVVGPIRGNLHHFTNYHVFYADTLQPSTLTIQNWSNSGTIYLSQSSEIYSQDSFKNTGGIFVKGNSSVGCHKKPTALGIVVAEGEIKAIIDEALDDAAFKSLFDKVAFLSKKRKLVIERAIHTNHYLDTEIRHHVNGRYTYSTHTGPVFQRRTTERKKQEIESSVQDFPPEAIQEQQKLQGRRAFLNDFKASLKDRLRSFAAVHANHTGLLAALIKGLGEAGLSDEDIGDILSQDEVQNLIDFSSTYDQLTDEARKELQTALPDVGSFLNGITAQAQRLSLPVWQWAQRNGPEFVEGVCNLAILASRYTAHPAVAVPARICTLGQMAPKVLQNLQKAQIFFSKKHEANLSKGASSAPQRVINPSKAESPIWKELKPYKGDIKTNGKTGKDQQYYQWDYLHNEIEMYDRNFKPIDALDPRTGERLFKDVKYHKPLKL